MIVCNGLDADSGEYLIAPLGDQEIAAAVGVGDRDSELEHEQRTRATQDEANLALIYGRDPNRLDEAGWAVVFPTGQDPEIRRKLTRLLDRRRDMTKGRYRCLADGDGYGGESKVDFLRRVGAPQYGAADPDRFPYYVLLVGSPAEVPFSFQRDLSLQYAVGRLDLDTLDDYETYARTVVEVEDEAIRLARAYVVAPSSPDDLATELSSGQLARPLTTALERHLGADHVSAKIGPVADRSAFEVALSGGNGPCLAFTASHGLGFEPGDERQPVAQGALVTAGWAGPGHAVERDSQVTADDLAGARPRGLIAFIFGCFTGGTPEFDSFEAAAFRRRLAPRPFVSPLPKRLLASGAMAVVGHVDRAWGYSFLGDHLASQTAAYESCLRAISDGVPVGAAMEWFAQLHGELGAELTAELDRVGRFKKPLPEELNPRWVATADAGAFAIAGDPATRFASPDRKP